MSDFGLSSTISTWGDVLTDYYGTKYDKQESELSYKRAIENRDYMNKYNSPVNQMKRLKEAGLNPNLMYGMGNVGEQKQSPNYQPVKARTTKKSIDPIDVAAIAQAKKTTEEAKAQKLSNEYNEATLAERINYRKGMIAEQSNRINLGMQKLEKYEWFGREQAKLANEALRRDITLKEFELKLNKLGMSKSDRSIFNAIIRGAIMNANELKGDFNENYLNIYNKDGE